MDKPKSKVKKPDPLKCIVRTMSKIALQNTNKDSITHRPTLTAMTTFIDQLIYRKMVEVLASNLPSAADSIAWKAHLKECKGDLDLAIDSFCAMFNVDRRGQPLPEDSDEDDDREIE